MGVVGSAVFLLIAASATPSHAALTDAVTKKAYVNGAEVSSVSPGDTVTYAVSEQSSNITNPTQDVTMTDTMSSNQRYVGGSLTKNGGGWSLTDPANNSTFTNTVLGTWRASANSRCPSPASQFLYGSNSSYVLGDVPPSSLALGGNTGRGDGHHPIFIRSASCDLLAVAVNHHAVHNVVCFNLTRNIDCSLLDANLFGASSYSYQVVDSKLYIFDSASAAPSGDSVGWLCFDFSSGTATTRCPDLHNIGTGANGLGSGVNLFSHGGGEGGLGYLNGNLYGITQGLTSGPDAISLACVTPSGIQCTSGTNFLTVPSLDGSLSRWAPLLTDKATLTGAPNGNKFVGYIGDDVYCLAITGVNTVTNCDGTSSVSPVATVRSLNKVWLSRVIDGKVNGFCVDDTASSCFDTDGHPSGTSSVFTVVGGLTVNHYQQGADLRAGTSQIVFSSFGADNCWDFSIDSLCGQVKNDPTVPYGTAFLPGSTSCFASFGDNGAAGFHFWTLTNGTITEGCDSMTSAQRYDFADPAVRYCAPGAGVSEWSDLTLRASAGIVPIGSVATYRDASGVALASATVTAAMGGGTATVVIPKPDGVSYAASHTLSVSLGLAAGASPGATINANMANTTTNGALPQSCYQAKVLDCGVATTNSATVGGAAGMETTGSITLNCQGSSTPTPTPTPTPTATPTATPTPTVTPTPPIEPTPSPTMPATPASSTMPLAPNLPDAGGTLANTGAGEQPGLGGPILLLGAGAVLLLIAARIRRKANR